MILYTRMEHFWTVAGVPFLRTAIVGECRAEEDVSFSTRDAFSDYYALEDREALSGRTVQLSLVGSGQVIGPRIIARGLKDS